MVYEMLILMSLASNASHGPESERCEMIVAAIEGEDESGLLDAGDCVLEEAGEDGRILVEPWVVQKRRRVHLLLRPGTVCAGKYLVVDRRLLARRWRKPFTAVVFEFRKKASDEYEYDAYLEALYPNLKGGGSPGCGAERQGNLVRAGQRWSRKPR